MTIRKKLEPLRFRVRVRQSRLGIIVVEADTDFDACQAVELGDKDIQAQIVWEPEFEVEAMEAIEEGVK